MWRKMLFLAVLLIFAVTVAVPAVAPVGIDLAESAGIEFSVDSDNAEPVQMSRPPCPPAGTGGNNCG